MFGSMPIGRSQKEDRHQDQQRNDGDGAPFHEVGVAVIDADVGFGEFVVVTLQICLLRIGIFPMYIHEVDAVQDAD